MCNFLGLILLKRSYLHIIFNLKFNREWVGELWFLFNRTSLLFLVSLIKWHVLGDFFTVCTGAGLKKKKGKGKLESLNSGDEGGYFRRLIVWNTNLHRKTAQGAAYFLHPSASFGCWPTFILYILFICLWYFW